MFPVRHLESVRKHHLGLQSFRSMRRIDARCKKASALRLRFSQSLASLRQRLSHAMVRSTIQRLGTTTNPAIRSERFHDFNVEMRENFRKSIGKLRSLIAAVGEQCLQERKHPKQR